MLHKLNVRDYMSSARLKFRPEQALLDAVYKLQEQELASAPVVDELGNIVGMLSELDCMKLALNAGYEQGFGGKVDDVMSRDVITVDADDSIVEVASRFVNSPYKCYPVVEDNRLIGQICRREVLRAILTMRQGATQD